MKTNLNTSAVNLSTIRKNNAPATTVTPTDAPTAKAPGMAGESYVAGAAATAAAGMTDAQSVGDKAKRHLACAYLYACSKK